MLKKKNRKELLTVINPLKYANQRLKVCKFSHAEKIDIFIRIYLTQASFIQNGTVKPTFYIFIGKPVLLQNS